MGLTIASVTGGRVWIAGEVRPSQWELWSGELPTGPWTRVAAVSLDRRWPAVCAFEKSFYFCGGVTEQRPSARVDRLDLASRSLQALPDLLTARSGGAAVGADGRVYLMGGDDGNRKQRSAAFEAFELEDRTWRSLAPLLEVRSELCALAIE